MDTRMYERDIILAEKEDLFFKEVVFDFNQAENIIPQPQPEPEPEPVPDPPPFPPFPPFPPSPFTISNTNTNAQAVNDIPPIPIPVPNPTGYEIGKVFIISSIDEIVKVEAYPTTDRAVMFNAWITKNVIYKTVQSGFNGTNKVGTGFIDDYGYPTVSGPMFQMTKLINFGGNIILDLPNGEMLKEDDRVVVLSAKIVGTHDKLYNKEPIYKRIDPTKGEYQSSILDESFNLYNKLIEKMCLKIKVRVIRRVTLNTEK